MQVEEPTMSRTLTVEQAAAKLQVKPNTVRRWIKHGRIPGCKIGRIFRISEADLDRVLSGGTVARPEVERAVLVREMRGKYRAVPGTVEDFLRERHEESQAEEQSK